MNVWRVRKVQGWWWVERTYARGFWWLVEVFDTHGDAMRYADHRAAATKAARPWPR